MTRLLHRFLHRILRWALRSPERTFAARGQNVAIFEPLQVNYPDRVFIGRDVYVGAGALFHSAGGLRIGDGCIFGPYVHIYTSNHRYEGADAVPFDETEYFEPVDIGRNVWIAGDAVILPGVTVGEGAVIAAGAVVVKDVPAGAVVGGCPARVLKTRDMDRYRMLVAEGKVLNALVGSGRNRPVPVGGIPRRWYIEAGLEPPPTAVDEGDAVASPRRDGEAPA